MSLFSKLTDWRAERVDRFRKPVVQCKGCGREIDVRELPLFYKFQCKECFRVLKINRSLFNFQFSRLVRKTLPSAFVSVVIVGYALYRGSKIADVSGRPLLCFGVAGVTALLVATAFLSMRARTGDMRTIGSVLIPSFALHRLSLILTGTYLREGGFPDSAALLGKTILFPHATQGFHVPGSPVPFFAAGFIVFCVSRYNRWRLPKH